MTRHPSYHADLVLLTGPHEKSVGPVPCPGCGGGFQTVKALNRHRSTAACQAERVGAILRADGWVRAAQLGPLLRKYGVPLRKELGFVSDGGRRRVRKLWWAPTHYLLAWVYCQRSGDFGEFLAALRAHDEDAVKRLATLAALAR